MSEKLLLVRTIACVTDYTYHGAPCEVGRVELWLDESVADPEILAAAKRLQVERLQSMRKRYLISEGPRNPYMEEK